MSIVALLFGKRGRREVFAEPPRADGRTEAARLVLRGRPAAEDAALFRAFVSGTFDDVLFAPLASLRGLNVAERESCAEPRYTMPEGELLPL